MITVKLQGGLGNQLFQYAAAKALAVKHNTKVAFDLSFLQNKDPHAQHTLREYELEAFNISFQQPPLIERFIFNNSANYIPNSFKKAIRRFLSGTLYQERSFSYDPAIELKTTSITYLNGYFQSEKYFKSIEPLLRSELQFSSLNSKTAQGIQDTCSVSLHVRRGDYVSNQAATLFHGLCSIDYYQQAVAYIAQRKENMHLFIFSDDPAWAREHLQLPYPTHFVEENTEKNSYRDMQLMSLCRHNIIANSSFSWWGAWLNPHQDKIVIAPKRWFADEVAQRQAQDIVPSTWIRL